MLTAQNIVEMPQGRLLYTDTETTGLDPQEGHRIVEIGCVEMIDGKLTGNNFHAYFNPRRLVDAEAAQVHGMTYKDLVNYPTFEECATDVEDYLSGATIIAHNAPFDMSFINKEFSREDISPISDDRVIDTLKIARKLFPGSPASLDALCRKFKISLSDRNLHGALIDAQLLSMVFVELTGGAQTSFESMFVSQDAKNKAENHQPNSLNFRRKPGKIIRPSNSEIHSFTDFLTNIKNPLWTAEEQANHE